MIKTNVHNLKGYQMLLAQLSSAGVSPEKNQQTQGGHA